MCSNKVKYGKPVDTFSHGTAPISSSFVVGNLSGLVYTRCKSLPTVKFCLLFVCQKMPYYILSYCLNPFSSADLQIILQTV